MAEEGEATKTMTLNALAFLQLTLPGTAHSEGQSCPSMNMCQATSIHLDESKIFLMKQIPPVGTLLPQQNKIKQHTHSHPTNLLSSYTHPFKHKPQA